MKTPEQITEEIATYHFPRIKEEGEGTTIILSARELSKMLTKAIEADRKQRDIYELIAEALDERAEYWPDDANAAKDAARSIRGECGGWYDDVWDRFIGPMLDAMEEEYGR